MDNILRHGKFLLLVLIAVVVILPGAATAQDSEPAEESEPEAQEELEPVAQEGASTTSEGEVPTIELQSGEEVAADQIIVKFEPGASGAAKEDVRSDEGLEKKEDLDLIDAEVVKVEDQSIEDTLSDLNSRSEVVYAEPDYVVYQSGDYNAESRFGELWGLNNTEQAVNGGSKGTTDVDINAPEAAKVTQGDKNLVVAVIDGGVDITHPELKGRVWTNPGEYGESKETNRVDDDGNGKVDDVHGWDFVNQDNTVYDYNPQEYHGTHVAGTIAGTADGKGIVGVAPEVQIMPLKFLGPDGKGLISNATDAIDYSVDPNNDGKPSDGAKISNNSWECTCTDSSALKGVVDASNQLIVAAAGNNGAGNSGVDNDTRGASAAKPASLESSNVLSVAAIDNKGNLANFSNYGAEKVDIAAPGVDVLSSFPTRRDLYAVTLSNIPNPGQTPQGRALVAGFGVDEIGDKDDRKAFMQKAFDAVGRANRDVVLVDDDGSDDGSGKSCLSPTSTTSTTPLPDTGPTLAEAIKEATGRAPIPKQIKCGSALGSGESFDTSKILVWATGAAPRTFDPATNDFKKNLTDADLTNLNTFLSNGGKLILTGMDALNSNENDPFVTGPPLRIRVQPNIPYARGFNGSSATSFDDQSYNLDGSTNNPNRHDLLTPGHNRAVHQGVYPSEPSWEFLDGTSMAAPHATGAAALAASIKPELLKDPNGLKQTVMNTGKLPGKVANGKTVTGAMVNAQAAADATKPQLKLPADIVEEATSKDGAVVSFNATANDTVDGNVPVSCSPVTGSAFPIGTTTVNCSAKDKAGNEATGSFNVTVQDTTPPIISGMPSDINEMATSKDGVEVTYKAPTATDKVDGDVSMTCDPASGSTFAPGTTTVNCSAKDKAGNEATGKFNVKVYYDFKGFFRPVDNPDTVNKAKAGSAVPVKFTLGGDMGLDVFYKDADSSAYPKSATTTCGSTNPGDTIEESVTANASGLDYDEETGQYAYVWKTSKDWAGSCRQLVVKLRDGETYRAYFQFV